MSSLFNSRVGTGPGKPGNNLEKDFRTWKTWKTLKKPGFYFVKKYFLGQNGWGIFQLHDENFAFFSYTSWSKWVKNIWQRVKNQWKIFCLASGSKRITVFTATLLISIAWYLADKILSISVSRPSFSAFLFMIAICKCYVNVKSTSQSTSTHW